MKITNILSCYKQIRVNRNIIHAKKKGIKELSLNYFFIKLKYIPDSIGKLTQLNILDLRWNIISALPESIGQLTQLNTLYLSGNIISELPESIGQLTQLNTLDLSGNKINDFPESITQLKQLINLNLSYTHCFNFNNKHKRSDVIWELTQLSTLNLSWNIISELPESIGQLTQLNTLDLSHNILSILPESIGQLTQLNTLDLSGNKISELPEFIGQLTQLKTLDLSGNKISELPEFIGQLTQLNTLDLSENKISELPESIGQLKQLKTLELGENKFSKLSNITQTLSPQIKIGIQNNPINDLSVKLLDDDIKQIRKYLQYQNKTILFNSGLVNIFLKKPTVLAIIETISMILFAFYGLLYIERFYWLIAVLFSPFLLLRTKHSKELGINWYQKAVHLLKVTDAPFAIEPSELVWSFLYYIYLPFGLIILGMSSIAIRILATFITVLNPKYFYESIRSIPENFKAYLLYTDMTTPPELVPGTEEEYNKNSQGVLTYSQLFNDYFVDILDNPSFIFTFIVGAIFFAIAWLYRFSIKATALFYWPILLVSIYSIKDIKESAYDHGKKTFYKDVRKWSTPLLCVYIAIFIGLIGFNETAEHIRQLYPVLNEIISEIENIGFLHQKNHLPAIVFHISSFLILLTIVFMQYPAETIIDENSSELKIKKAQAWFFSLKLINIICIMVVLLFAYRWVAFQSTELLKYLFNF